MRSLVGFVWLLAMAMGLSALAPSGAQAAWTGDYRQGSSSQAFIDATQLSGFTRTLIDSDDGTATLPGLPFDFDYYGVTYPAGTGLVAHTNGVITFGAAGAAFENTCLPTAAFGSTPALLPYWDDLVTGSEGVGAATSGLAPNRKFVVTWKAKPIGSSSPQTLNFSVLLEERTDRIYFTYGPMGGYSSGTATGGIQQSATGLYTQSKHCTEAPPLGGTSVVFTPDDPPIAVDDAVTVTTGSGPTAIDILGNDQNPDGGWPPAVVQASDPAHGAITLSDFNLGGWRLIEYQPDVQYCNSQSGASPDTFTYEVQGGSTATVQMTVTCADSPPTAVNDSAVVNEDSGANAIGVLANDTDIDGGPKTIASVTPASSGTVIRAEDGSGLTYSPVANFCGPDSFAYTLNGGSGATVSITVSCVDEPTQPDRAAPATTITGRPKPVVRSSREWVSILFRFTSSEHGSRFVCKLDRRAFAPCASPRRYRLRRGDHHFQVAAIDASGNRDASPAKYSFRVTRRRGSPTRRGARGPVVQ